MFYVMFSDAKNALLLFLLPTYLKPTGKPQQSIATAQNNFILYTSNVAKLQISGDHPPCLIILVENDDEATEGDKEKIVQIIAYFDGNKYICSTIIEALGAVYKFYWLFGISYPKSTNNTWMVIQKYFYKMSYAGESQSPNSAKLLSALYSGLQEDEEELSAMNLDKTLENN
uniref:Uncharacterized protein n=1 Tax=Megaselia scalaris TaxID=36166 RepID=T1H2S2_MEGSC